MRCGAEQPPFTSKARHCALGWSTVGRNAAVDGSRRLRPTTPLDAGYDRIATAAAAAALVLLGTGFAAREFAGRSDGDVAAIAAMVADRPREIALVGALAHGSAIVGHAGRRTAFVVSGLPPAPSGRGYQVWVRGAGVRSPGMLDRMHEGLEVLVVPGDALAGARHVGVTVEPAGGSPARTGPPQVSGEVGA